VVADSGALRNRRYRACKAGDHHLCRHDGRGAAVVLPPADCAPLDSRASLEALARRLEAAHEADPGNAMVARELRATLLALAPEGGGMDPELADLFASFG
jgi:hypothetical protein